VQAFSSSLHRANGVNHPCRLSGYGQVPSETLRHSAEG
jgi:hypothetical protein